MEPFQDIETSAPTLFAKSRALRSHLRQDSAGIAMAGRPGGWASRPGGWWLPTLARVLDSVWWLDVKMRVAGELENIAEPLGTQRVDEPDPRWPIISVLSNVPRT